MFRNRGTLALIYRELILIRKELRAIRSSKEPNTVVVPITLDGKEVAKAIVHQGNLIRGGKED